MSINDRSIPSIWCVEKTEDGAGTSCGLSLGHAELGREESGRQVKRITSSSSVAADRSYHDGFVLWELGRLIAITANKPSQQRMPLSFAWSPGFIFFSLERVSQDVRVRLCFRFSYSFVLIFCPSARLFLFSVIILGLGRPSEQSPTRAAW